MNMPGFTNGACDNKRGTDQLDQVLAKRWPAGLWNAYWYEGTVGNAFEESHFLFKPVQGTAGFNAESDITIIVDKFMKIKANCGSTTNSTFVLTDEALKQVVIPYKNRTQMLPLAECYFTDTRVDVKEPREKEWLWITLQFRPAFRMFAGEQITYNLAGLTNSNYTGLTGFNAVKGKGGADQASLAIVKDLRDLACDGQMCFDVFSANWKEVSERRQRSSETAKQRSERALRKATSTSELTHASLVAGVAHRGLCWLHQFIHHAHRENGEEAFPRKFIHHQA